ncbi:hypothetical protein E2P81_ATG10835 [Venturia nashicola]|uniref:Uncharacterized protein n=1 Tax=Venturia nashicola TaxID=86259 RepID=A0A4Z1P738_9PEZI|nr:hypothetical protein E6O75_ATG10508 [Venturia nashicola]TLD27547.1 hypothetical protein E2P81_ATG10835 [Venturia nashicola]
MILFGGYDARHDSKQRACNTANIIWNGTTHRPGLLLQFPERREAGISSNSSGAISTAPCIKTTAIPLPSANRSDRDHEYIN